MIPSAFMFKMEARVGGYGTEIKTGEYTFARGTQSEVILQKLTAGAAVPTVEITIPEGLSLEETAQEVAGQSGVSAAKFEEAAKRTDYGYGFLEDPAIKTTEGFLFPKQYEFEKGTEAPQMVTRMLEQYLLETQTLDISSARERLNLSEYELVIVASLIEKEAATPEERPLVASVIYNRLQKDMPLQIDASIHYALDKQGEELSLADLEVNSPYNTYENKGLPPGPICSPSRQSLWRPPSARRIPTTSTTCSRRTAKSTSSPATTISSSKPRKRPAAEKRYALGRFANRYAACRPWGTGGHLIDHRQGDIHRLSPRAS